MANMASKAWRKGIREMRGNRGTRRALKTVQNAPTTPVRAESQMKSWLAWRARRSGEHDMKGRRSEELFIIQGVREAQDQQHFSEAGRSTKPDEKSWHVMAR